MRSALTRRASTRGRAGAGVALALVALLLGAAPAGAAAAPAPPTAGPSAPAPGARSDVGGELMSRTGVVKQELPGRAFPALPTISSASWLIADLDSGEILAARDAHGRYAPASTLKTLTAVALLPVVPADRLVTPAREDVAVDGSRVGLVEEMRYPAKQLFTAMLVVSGNDAAGALATAVGGMGKATALMNAEAARLQALDTRAVNTSGLDAPGQASSAYDLALIARAGMSMPDFQRYVAVRKSAIAAPGGKSFEIYNHNRLLGSYEGALGIKNGYTKAARASFVGAAERGDRRLVVTLMRGNPRPDREAALLLDYGFAVAARGYVPVGQLVDPLPAPGKAPPTQDSATRAVPGAQAAPVGLVDAAGTNPDGDERAPWVPAGLLVIGLGAGVLLVRQHRAQTAREQRTARSNRYGGPR